MTHLKDLKKLAVKLITNNIKDLKKLAVKLIIENCLYGVDLNNTAVEIAKITLYFISKGTVSFDVLNTKLKCGNSLLGFDNIKSVKKMAIDFDEKYKHKKYFHWYLEFPEVLKNGGFDSIIGNPPFLGGSKITNVYGVEFRDFLIKYVGNNHKGKADLCAYFFLRAANLIKIGGTIGFLATNTISQGDTRKVGLEQLVQNKMIIYSAFPNLKWPGKAAVAVSIVHLFKEC